MAKEEDQTENWTAWVTLAPGPQACPALPPDLVSQHVNTASGKKIFSTASTQSFLES
jgi:hypothetical protein